MLSFPILSSWTVWVTWCWKETSRKLCEETMLSYGPNLPEADRMREEGSQKAVQLILAMLLIFTKPDIFEDCNDVTYIQTYMHTHTQTCIHINAWYHMYLSIYLSIYIYKYTYAYIKRDFIIYIIYIHKYIERVCIFQWCYIRSCSAPVWQNTIPVHPLFCRQIHEVNTLTWHLLIYRLPRKHTDKRPSVGLIFPLKLHLLSVGLGISQLAMFDNFHLSLYQSLFPNEQCSISLCHSVHYTGWSIGNPSSWIMILPNTFSISTETHHRIKQ